MTAPGTIEAWYLLHDGAPSVTRSPIGYAWHDNCFKIGFMFHHVGKDVAVDHIFVYLMGTTVEQPLSTTVHLFNGDSLQATLDLPY